LFVERVDFKAIIARDRWTCGLCGGKVKPADLNIDHIIPLSKNGPHAYWNLQVAHEVCNKRKGNKLIGQPRLPI
jgi:5-methylcytosine-specific restriction endonuclease McrA